MSTSDNPDTTIEALMTLSMEYANLRSGMQHCPLGVYVVPSDSLFRWDGVLFVHKGYYADAILKFRLTFPRSYPESPPTVHFITDVFHPLVSQSDGLFSLAARFHSWRPKQHHVFDVLHWIKAAFKRHQLDQLQETDCLNKDAFRYRDATPSFAALAAQTSALSNSPSALYDNHISMVMQKQEGIPFCELKQDVLHHLREKLGLHEWVIEST